MTEQELRAVLSDYLTLLQRHPSAEEMTAAVLTEDFETGFEDGHLWKGLDGLRDFLAARDGFFDESHRIQDVLELEARAEDEVYARTRLTFFLRSWAAPAATSTEYTGDCFHHWRVVRAPDRWRVGAQIVERFDNLNDAAERLFATPAAGLNR